MKRKLIRIVSFFMLLAMLIPGCPAAAAESVPTRVINLVYDDSGSMIASKQRKTDKSASVDTWCKARYAMEVFVAMLGDKDTMNVFAMSDFDKAATAKPRITLYGRNDAQTNVDKVEASLQTSGNTKFNSVVCAYNELIKTTADEKWLVILTDGEFQYSGSTTDKKLKAFINDKANDINVVYMGMGEEAKKNDVDDNKSKGIYSFTATSNNEILEKLTDICTLIFNSDRLKVDSRKWKFSFDIPMKELVVFAQGDSVKINGIKDSDGNLISGSRTPVNVKYSKTATKQTDIYPQSCWVWDDKLSGSIMTITGDFDSGDYSVDVSGAETVEIYYKPNVDIAIFLTDADGAKVTDMTTLDAGTYTISFGLVRAGTEEQLPASELLGDISYYSYITINGECDGQIYQSGSKVNLKEGTFDVDVTADYLRYNSVSANKHYNIYCRRNLDLTVVSEPTYSIEGDGLKGGENPIMVRATLEGAQLTDEQWQLLNPLVVKMTENADTSFAFTVEKAEENGLFYVYPKVYGESLSPDKEYPDIGLEFSSSTVFDDEAWVGKTDGTLKLQDKRNKILTLEVVSEPEYILTKDGISNSDEPTVVEAKLDGERMTAEEWAGVNSFDISQVEHKDKNVEFTYVKTDEPGILHLFPKLTSDKPKFGTDYGNIGVKLEEGGGKGVENWSGTQELEVKISDTRSFFEKNTRKIILGLVGLGLFIILLGYLLKKKLPKSLSKMPVIEEWVKGKRGKVDTYKGSFKKKTGSYVLPFVPQQGYVKFVPNASSVRFPKTLNIQATGNNKFKIKNAAGFAEITDVWLDGNPGDSIAKDHNYPASLTVNYKYTSGGKSYEGECTLNSK